MTSASRRNRWRLDRVVGVGVEDLLQGHLAMQFGVQGHEDGAQAAACVRPEDAEPLARAGCLADRVTRRAVGVIGALRRVRAEVGQGTADIGIVDAIQTLAGGTARRDRGQTSLHVAAVLLDVACHQGIHSGSIVGIKVAASDEVVGQGAGLVEGPGLEGGYELALVNQPVL